MITQSVTSKLRTYFAQIGLNAEIADIYLALCKYGPQSLLGLSRNAGIERTRLYRLVDALVATQLIEIEEEYKRKTYKAAPIANVQILLSKKQQELNNLHDTLQELQAELNHAVFAAPHAHVQFYQGKEGVKQMLWNETRAQGENLSILHGNMQAYTNEAFFTRWAERCNARGITFRSVASDHFLQSQNAWYKAHNNSKLAKWSGRYVPSDVFSITHSTVIYDDVVAYYNWEDGETFGSEVHNKQIAHTQRQFFELLWNLGKPIENYGINTLTK